jgi:hypothetical protein
MFELDMQWKKEYTQELFAVGIMKLVEEALNAAGANFDTMPDCSYEQASWKADVSRAVLYYKLADECGLHCVEEYQKEMAALAEVVAKQAGV